MRAFQSITRGRILEELRAEGLQRLNSAQLLRVERKLIASNKLPAPRRNGGGWRIYTEEEKEVVKKAIWDYYGGKV